MTFHVKLREKGSYMYQWGWENISIWRKTSIGTKVSSNHNEIALTIPLVGSSNKTVLESPQKAIATLSFLFIPPLRFFDSVFRFAERAPSWILALTFSSAALADSLLAYIPLILAKNSACSFTVSSGKRQSCCRQMPISPRTPVISVLISFPATVAYPSVGVTIPVSILIVVVFPVGMEQICQQLNENKQGSSEKVEKTYLHHYVQAKL